VIIAFALVNPVSAQPETIYVFANINVPDSALAQGEIQNIYLGKKDKWSDNQKINFTALSSGQCHEAFIKQYVKRTDFQFQNYWKQQIFTGKGQPPRGFASEAELIDYVSRTAGAIGYSCTMPDTGKVKMLTIN
jgi:ABC-type phosphate transport system substrate-binding protein